MLRVKQIFYPQNCFIGRSNGTFGELLQGELPKIGPFLVSFPAHVFSTAFFYNINSIPLQIFPSEKWKSEKITEILQKYFCRKIFGIINVVSNIPPGKGFASSTADMTAVIRAVCKGLNIKINNHLVSKFLSEIDPSEASDGVVHNNKSVLFLKNVIKHKLLGRLPKLCILAIDEGGQIDTIEYSHSKKTYDEKSKVQYANLLNILIAAISKKDIVTIGKVATESAYLNQKYNNKLTIEKLYEINTTIGGIGIAVAHSGTVAGILLDAADKGVVDKIVFGKKCIIDYGKNVEIYFSA